MAVMAVQSKTHSECRTTCQRQKCVAKCVGEFFKNVVPFFHIRCWYQADVQLKFYSSRIINFIITFLQN
jgi:hypothetical protein